MAKTKITPAVYAALSTRYDDRTIAKKFKIALKTLQNNKSKWGDAPRPVHEHVAGVLMALPLEDTADLLEAAAAIDLLTTAKHRDALLGRMVAQSEGWKPARQLELLAILHGSR